jgi:glutathione synthase/RimK-type ligase-like ATP-grasp enzyme
MRIAIHQNKEVFNHSTDWGPEWVSYCEANGIEYYVVNCFDHRILETVKGYDVLLWHFSNYSLQDMLFARTILSTVKDMGVKVFPDFNTSWHFDDKIAQMYLLQSIGAPIPRSWAFFTKSSAQSFFEHECSYPVVAKLRCGSGSSNVKLLSSKQDALRYTKKMFGSGVVASPNVLFKVKSNVKSASDWKTIQSRMRRIPDFIESIRKTRQFPKEKGYVYVQEFVPNDGYDLKVVVVGDKLSFLVRDVRKGDFRASGGGSIRYDKQFLTEEIRELAFALSDRLGFQSMGYDFVIDNRTETPMIVEISYGFSHTAQMDLGGYWDRNGVWHDQPLNAPHEVLRSML